MRTLLLLAVVAFGCAGARPAPVARNEVSCEYLGRMIFNSHNPVLDSTQSMGPSQVIWVHPEDHTLRVVAGQVYSCPLG